MKTSRLICFLAFWMGAYWGDVVLPILYDGSLLERMAVLIGAYWIFAFAEVGLDVIKDWQKYEAEKE